MFTIALAFIHSRSTNKGTFDPFVLYIATFIIDMTLVEGLLRIFK